MIKKVKGFTLIELLVVIAIIAILSVVGFALFTNAQVRARDAKRQEDIAALQNAVRQYVLANNTLPKPTGANWYCSSLSDTEIAKGGVAALSELASLLVPKYIQQLPIDPLNGQSKCNYTGNDLCRYCYTPDWSPGGGVFLGIGGFYTYTEKKSSTMGDGSRFIAPQVNLWFWAKSIDPMKL